jgi:hypothetical protein
MRSFISNPYEYIAGFRDVVQQQSLSADVTCYWVFGMQADVKPVLDSILKLNKEIEDIRQRDFQPSHEPSELFAIYRAEKELTRAEKASEHAMKQLKMLDEKYTKPD